MAGLPPWLVPLADQTFGRLIDHTLLKPEAGEADILRLCDQAVELGLGAVCVNGQWVELAAGRLSGTGVTTAGVAGFPLGASGEALKVEEARRLHGDGAGEIDLVQALGYAKAGRWDELGGEIASVVAAVPGCVVKVILETAALSPAEIESSCKAAREAGARFVKTSTGFHPLGGATTQAVDLLRRCVGPNLGVKASGGIRTAEEAIAMLRAGASRIGTSGAAGWPTHLTSSVLSSLL